MENCLQKIRSLQGNLNKIESAFMCSREYNVEDIFDCEYHLTNIQKSVFHLTQIFERISECEHNNSKGNSSNHKQHLEPPYISEQNTNQTQSSSSFLQNHTVVKSASNSKDQKNMNVSESLIDDGDMFECDSNISDATEDYDMSEPWTNEEFSVKSKVDII